MKEITLNRQLLGLEDILFGFGTTTQTRGGQTVNITKINAGNMPFDETRTLIEFAQQVNLEALGQQVTAIQNLNANLSAIEFVNSNLNSITALSALETELTSLYNNISAIQSVNNNSVNISTVASNISSINSIVSQIIPNLTEILLVDTNAAQVTLDKNEVTTMKLAVETIYDTFDDRFLGAFTVNPTLDNDGNALITGALYFNTSTKQMKVYDVETTTWYSLPQIYLSALLDVELVSISTNNVLIWNGTKWVNSTLKTINGLSLIGNGDLSISAGGGYAANVYLTTIASSTNGSYSQLSYTPEVAETILSTTVNNNTVLIEDYIFDGDVQAQFIPAGEWGFHFHRKVDNTAADTKIIFEVYKRSSTGVETVLFTASSLSIEDTSFTREDLLITKPSFVVDATDRVGLKVYAATTRTSDVTVQLKVGDGEACYFNTPLAIRHNQLRARDEVNSHTIGSITNLQETLDSKVSKVASTDYAVPRFNGATGDLQDSQVIISDSGYIRCLQSGSASAPSIQPGNDGDTGFYWKGSNTVGVANAGVNSASFNADGTLESHLGIKCPNSTIASATVLDWYEEGTFTPVVVGSATTGVGTYSNQTGVYTRIGDLVYFSISIVLTDHTGAGNMYITGLPFVPEAVQSAILGYLNVTSFTGDAVTVLLYSTEVRLRTYTNGGTAGYVPIDTNAQFYISGVYKC